MKGTTQLLAFRPTTTLRPFTILPTKPPAPTSRTFVSNPLAPTSQSLSATRILPYRASALYALIADIASYPSFLPYCTSSTVTSWSDPHSTTHTRYPRTASLSIGWHASAASYSSRVFCAPNSVVEAVAGAAKPSIPASELQHYNTAGTVDTGADGTEIFSSLLARWTLREFPFKPLPPDGARPQDGNASAPSKARTEVSLVIEMEWASAVMAAMAGAVTPKVAGVMVDAFERRAKEVLGEGEVVRGNGGGGMVGTEEEEGSGVLEGVLGGSGKGMEERP